MTTFTAKEKAIAIAPKVTAVLSMMGSGFIIHQMLFYARHKHGKRCLLPTTTVNRLLLGMSCCDLIVSFTFFLTSWPIPVENTSIYGASGNQATCIAQGFFSQFSLAVVLYNASLSVYYLVKIRYQWRDRFIAHRVEPWLHGGALLGGLGTSVAGVALDLYNNDSWECWIAPLPQDCRETWQYGSSNCLRGDNASLYRWVFYYGPLWCAMLLVTVAMLAVYRSVLKAEKAVERYGEGQFTANTSGSSAAITSGTRDSTQRRKHSKKVATQGYWYCGAFYITWLLPTATRLTQLLMVGDAPPYPLILLTAMFVPIQGFFNCLVYIHPRYKTLRKDVRATLSSHGGTQGKEASAGQNVVSESVAIQEPNVEDDNPSLFPAEAINS